MASGSGADRLAVRLRDAPGVTAAAAFGTTLHVCGPDREALLKAIEPCRADPAIKWEEAEPTLEDIFIHLMGKARDNALDAMSLAHGPSCAGSAPSSPRRCASSAATG